MRKLFFIVFVMQICVANLYSRSYSCKTVSELEQSYNQLFVEIENERKSILADQRNFIQYVSDYCTLYNELSGSFEFTPYSDKAKKDSLYYSLILDKFNPVMSFYESIDYTLVFFLSENCSIIRNGETGSYNPDDNLRDYCNRFYMLCNKYLTCLQQKVLVESDEMQEELESGAEMQMLESYNSKLSELSDYIHDTQAMLRPLKYLYYHNNADVIKTEIERGLYAKYLLHLNDETETHWNSSELKSDISELGIAKEAEIDTWWINYTDVESLVYWAENLYVPNTIKPEAYSVLGR